jgi:hypothetical protein
MMKLFRDRRIIDGKTYRHFAFVQESREVDSGAESGFEPFIERSPTINIDGPGRGGGIEKEVNRLPDHNHEVAFGKDGWDFRTREDFRYRNNG